MDFTKVIILFINEFKEEMHRILVKNKYSHYRTTSVHRS